MSQLIDIRDAQLVIIGRGDGKAHSKWAAIAGGLDGHGGHGGHGVSSTRPLERSADGQASSIADAEPS